MENRPVLTLLRIFSSEIEAVEISRTVVQGYVIDVWRGWVRSGVLLEDGRSKSIVYVRAIAVLSSIATIEE